MTQPRYTCAIYGYQSTEYVWTYTNIGVDSGKGTPRRKVKKVQKASGSDDKKLQTALKKLNVQPIQAIEEVNMFKDDGNVIHFAAPKGNIHLHHVVSYVTKMENGKLTSNFT